MRYLDFDEVEEPHKHVAPCVIHHHQVVQVRNLILLLPGTPLLAISYTLYFLHEVCQLTLVDTQVLLIAGDLGTNGDFKLVKRLRDLLMNVFDAASEADFELSQAVLQFFGDFFVQLNDIGPQVFNTVQVLVRGELDRARGRISTEFGGTGHD